MATTPNKNFAAGADLSANKDRFVFFDGSGDLIAATAGSDIIGIQTDKPTTGQTVGLTQPGIQAKLKIGGTVTRGDKLKSDSAGRGIATTAGGDIYGAKALQSGVVDDLINVETVTAVHPEPDHRLLDQSRQLRVVGGSLEELDVQVLLELLAL